MTNLGLAFFALLVLLGLFLYDLMRAILTDDLRGSAIALTSIILVTFALGLVALMV